MKTVFTSGDFKEIEISGSKVEWLAFSDVLKSGDGQIDCDHVANPSPYSKSAAMIQVIRDVDGRDNKVSFQIDKNDCLLVRGDSTQLQKLSLAAEGFGKNFEKNDHIHIEYQGESHFVAQDSTPVVFMHLGTESSEN